MRKQISTSQNQGWRTQTGNGIIKCLLGKVASLVRGVEDLVIEDREIQSQPEANGVRRCKVRDGYFCC